MQYFYCILFVLNALLHNAVYCSSWNPQKVNSYQNFYQSIVQTNNKPQPSYDYSEEPTSNTNEYELIDSQQCSPALHKIVFTQDYFRQYILYKHDIPALKEFTLCMWMKFYNHSTDHPLFTYSVDGQPKAIYSWVSNTAQSSFLSLAIDGQTFYRLNYPFKVYKWYHSCQSWNGQTGEWQMWINGERVGRGFHNRLVGHRIRPGGIAITGQERASNSSSSSTASRGFQGELTMLQMYKVALTAGKAYADHKHHHVHLFDHHGRPITTTLPPTTTTTSPFASVRSQSHPLLTGNQLNPMLQLNFGLMPMQPMGYVDLSSLRIVSLDNLNSLVYGKHRLTKRDQNNDNNKPKRDLFYDTKNGHLVNLVDLSTREQFEQYTGLSSSNNEADTTATAALLADRKPENVQQQTTEIAAAEVSAIMNICSGCDSEPFKTSLVLSWRTDSKKIFSNSVLALANPICKRF